MVHLVKVYDSSLREELACFFSTLLILRNTSRRRVFKHIFVSQVFLIYKVRYFVFFNRQI